MSCLSFIFGNSIFQRQLVWVSISRDRLIRESCCLGLRPTILHGSILILRPMILQIGLAYLSGIIPNNVYHYSLSHELTLVSFHLWNMCCFIVGLPLDVGFEIYLEVDAAVWCSDIDPINAWWLIVEFWRLLMVITTFKWCCRLSIWGSIVY